MQNTTEILLDFVIFAVASIENFVATSLCVSVFASSLFCRECIEITKMCSF
jgi:hypothetical protein